jgi:probable HAF family extracellular repeat protein
MGTFLCPYTEATMIGLPVPVQYVIRDLGTLGGVSSLGLAINAAGTVTGLSYLSSVGPHSGAHAFRYEDSVGIVDVGALSPGNLSWGYGINDNGMIVGGSVVGRGDHLPHAFLADGALALIDLGTLGGDFSFAYDINNVIIITGEADNQANHTHAFIWSPGNMRDIGTLAGGDRSVGRSINESCQVAGESTYGHRYATLAFRFTEADGMVSLGTLAGGFNSSGYGINNSGQVVGESDTGPILHPFGRVRGFPFFGTHAFFWTEGDGMRDLGHLGGGTSRATAISNTGQVVGTSSLIGGPSHAFSWTSREGMIDLNTLLPLNSGWVLLDADGVNDKGQITGYGLHNGVGLAFRLDPYEPVLYP